jgi:hypothetical protein
MSDSVEDMRRHVEQLCRQHDIVYWPILKPRP